MILTEGQLINKYLGWEYLHHGREEGKVDCWGLILFIYKECFDINILDLEEYEKNWALRNKNLFIENYYKNWLLITQPKFLDVILFNNSKRITFHAGVYLSNGKFIHGSKAGVVITRLDGKWKERVEGYYRYER